ncbi:MAG: amidase family protein, partial [Melioribacteraceae bacterium]
MLNYKNHSEKISLIKEGRLSLHENVSFFLNNIKEKSNLNAYNFVFEDCIEQASSIEQKIKNGSAGKLAGMVIAVKDVLAINQQPLTCSSNILRDFISIYTASAVQKLIDADAIIIGKTNC